MNQKIRLFDYQSRQKEFFVKDFEKAIMCRLEINFGDWVLEVIYPDHIESFDSSDCRLDDEIQKYYYILPKDIDVLRTARSNYDTSEIKKVSLKHKHHC